MSWWNHDVENPLDSQAYRDCMMALAYTILGQPDEKLLETILKAPYILRWPIESSGGGGYEPDSKRPRTTYILDSCAGLGGSTASCGVSKTHIEHPWHFEGTKQHLMRAASLAREAMENRLDRLQCAEAIVEIMDARRHSVLMPGCAQTLFGHDLAKDGFTARYQGCVVLRRDNKTQVDFAVEDQLTAKRVDDAMNFLAVGTGSRTWTWNTNPPRSGPALGNLIGTITPPKTSKAATPRRKSTYEVSVAHLRAAMIKIGIDPDSPANPGPKGAKNGYSYRTKAGSKNLMEQVKLETREGYPTGKFATIPGKPTFRSLTLEEFEDHVETIVQQLRIGVY